MLAKEGVLTKRQPTDQESTNITYGRAVAQHLARFDIGQTVVIAEAACIAVEAMEGTDATILRAGELLSSPSLGEKASTLGRELTVVKVAKPNQDMRFDVPVIGLRTIETMKRANATCLALDAGKCLLLDGSAIVDAADAAGIAIVAEQPTADAPRAACGAEEDLAILLIRANRRSPRRADAFLGMTTGESVAWA